MTNDKERFGQSDAEKFHHKEHKDRAARANFIPLPLGCSYTAPHHTLGF